MSARLACCGRAPVCGPVLLYLLLLPGGCALSGPDPNDEDGGWQELPALSESFDAVPDGVIPAGWDVLTQTAAVDAGPADWSVREGVLRQLSKVRAPASPDMDFAFDYEGTMALVGDTGWADFRFQVRFQPMDDKGVGVVFRWTPADDDQDGRFYRFLIVHDCMADGPKIRLDRRSGGQWTILREHYETYPGETLDDWHELDVQAVGADLTIRLDGELMFVVRDPLEEGGLVRGRIGFFCYDQAGAGFDDVEVRRIIH